MLTLLDLPVDILWRLPLYVDNIETLISLAGTCRKLRSVCSSTLPQTIFQLAAASAPTFFSPHPHFLVMAVAPQIRDWALGNEENSRRLRLAFQGGIEGLYKFCVNDKSLNAGLTLDRIRTLYEARFTVINPFADKIDKMAGNQWYEAENFWSGGVSEPDTVYSDSNRAAMQIIIYGELFGSSMRPFLESGARGHGTGSGSGAGSDSDSPLPFFDLETRLDFIKYCVPDSVCQDYPGLHVLPVGPYAPENREDLPADQYALRHILGCRRWRRLWADAMAMVGPLFAAWDAEKGPWDEEQPGGEVEGVWRLKLFRNALQTMGLEGMQLVTLPREKISPDVLAKARRMREQIEVLREPPPVYTVGHYLRASVSQAPDPAQDIYVCMAAYWPGTD
ncbi:conserved hypothetical protein [Histoplasma capsulatum G186AR]|uniref:F-box domain-containing protein n=2 Tax=Ajellomyces capsulatus TaxID=5037 RepID=C0NX35_AJECG|nr:uncharacterized protein HCBG_08027 [Histoplasma capsulatum G186AR]EEH03901.1 conserved hypothetical protein [Histoplasma capsulatum G186AR]KAG5295511.1 hypothetical protein I7I52_05797 [Histoplasma capsulatum]QSS73492.1 hypothetical protein I7I50_08281 [Histoplasma capsulatum G186AR]